MMNKLLLSSASALVLVASADAANIALGGTATMGHTDATLAVTNFHLNGFNYTAGDVARVNDNLFAAFVDTYGDAGQGGGDATNTGYDYVGVTGLVIPVGEQITQVVLEGRIFIDGGWFGTNGNNNTATAIAPTIQVSIDNGTSWTNVTGVTDNYVAQVSGLGANTNYTATFDFAGITGVNALRVAGQTGGNAGSGSDGFLGARELQINTTAIPEPSSAALLSIGGLSLVLRRRK